MTKEVASIVQRVWGFCNPLRDAGLSYGDYVEQLTYLLFLKMDDEQTRRPFNRKPSVPVGLDWQSLVGKDGEELERHYRHILEALGKAAGLLGVVFKKADNRIKNPALLKRLVVLIGSETWLGLGADVKGAIYEGLLEKNAEDVKSGAGQYFTPRTLIRAMVACLRPRPGEAICDPACGTGGFFLASHDFLTDPKNYALDKAQKRVLRYKTFRGNDIVDDVVRLCVMNLMLHGIGGNKSPITGDDALVAEPSDHFELVMTNPPFGKKSSFTIVNAEGKADKATLTYERPDFWATTSNKQLNFLQHVKALLKMNGRCGIVVPDNVLFEGGAGETVRRKLLHECDVHTLLRLPTGIFYAQGVKANVLFFDRRPGREKPWTEKLWIYDLRTNKHFTLKTSPLSDDDLKEFVTCYNPAKRHERKESERFKCFGYDELVARDKASLDIFWLKDKSLEDLENLPEPDVLAREITESLETALEQFRGIAKDLEE